MAVIHIHRIRCNGCDREEDLESVNNWLEVTQMVTNTENYIELVMQAQQTGMTAAYSGHFCSLKCVSSWALSAETLSNMEDGLFKDPEPPDEGELT